MNNYAASASTTRTVDVVASAAPTPPPTLTLSKLTVTRCMGTAKGARKNVTVGYTVSAPSRVTFTLQRGVKTPRGNRRTCPRTLPPGDYVNVRRKGARAGTPSAALTAAPKRRVLRRTVSVGAGAHKFRLKTLLGSRTLKAGRYRVRVQAVSAEGAKAQEGAAYFWVLQHKKRSRRRRGRALGNAGGGTPEATVAPPRLRASGTLTTVPPPMGSPAPDAEFAESAGAGGVRRLAIPAFVAIVVAYLVIVQGVGALAQAGLDGFEDGHFRTSEQVALGLLLPIGLSVLFVYAVVAALGWWRPVLIDDRPVQPWVWVVPVVFGVAILVAVDYAALADKGIGFVALLLVAALCVGFAEEGMFRGIGVTTFRINGFSERHVALWSSVVFGAVHLTNAISTGGAAIAQAIAVSFAGYFFYLTRRVSGGLIVPAVVHGLFDFSILSGTVVDDQLYVGSLGPILAYPVVAIILLVRRHHIELTARDT